MQPIVRQTIVERRQPIFRWSAVIAGIAVALASWLTLQLLGTGAGLAAIDTDDSGSLRGVGIGTGVWTVIVPLLAMFAGGFVAARLASTWNRRHALMHGLVLWAVSILLGGYLLTSAIGAVVGTASRAASGAGRYGPDMMHAVGIDAEAMVGPVNERLRADGKPEVTADELRGALRSTVRRSFREGRFDRDVAAAELARHTSLSRTDAQEIAADLESQWDEDVAPMKEAALGAADTAGKAMLGAGIALLLGLGAALGGAALGIQRRRDEPTPAVRVEDASE